MSAKPKVRWLGRGLWGALALVGTALALFLFNGASDGWRVPATGSVAGVQPALQATEVRVLAFNLAKCDFYEGGVSFVDEARIRERLDRVAAVIEREHIDVACLSEVVFEAGTVRLDQARYLAEKCRFARFATGENYNFGLPFLRVRSGNAILSRFPLVAIETLQLDGGRPFFWPTNNRRALWCTLEIGGVAVLTGSLRNDSFDLANNLAQLEGIQAYVGDRPTLLAGDFNAGVDSASMQAMRASARFTSSARAIPTFPAHAPDRRLDYVFAPRAWLLVEEHEVDVGMSDHLGVVARFALR